MGQDVQAREDPETETDEKKLKNAQKPQEVKTERWRVWKKSQERPENRPWTPRWLRDGVQISLDNLFL